MIAKLIARLKAAWSAFLHPEIIEIRDDLTGALNRRSFKFLAERELVRAQRGQPLSVVYLDLDNLKEVNDTKGHEAGDLYLKEFTQTIMSHIRPYDFLARWGGDEFVLLLSGADSVVAEKIVSRIYNLFPHFSWGISSWLKGEDLDSLIKKADAEMYRAKSEKKK